METFTAIEKLSTTQPLTVEDFEKERINYRDIMEEATYLREQIPTLRQKMNVFLTGLTIIDPKTTSQEFFKETAKRVQDLHKTIEQYIERYKKLVPLLELANKELNIDTKTLEKIQPTIQIPTPASCSSGSVNTPATSAGSTTTKKQATARKRTYNKKGSVSNGVNPEPVTNTYSQAPPQATINNNNVTMNQQGNFINGMQQQQGNQLYGNNGINNNFGGIQ